jgi:hypothetical protein
MKDEGIILSPDTEKDLEVNVEIALSTTESEYLAIHERGTAYCGND